jgi:cell division protein FtsI/penicillin-binding protein 2
MKQWRLNSLLIVIYLSFFLILGRLFYWQVYKSKSLQAQADQQYYQTLKLQGSRGSIFTADQHLLVGNQTVYRLFAEPKNIEKDAHEVAVLVSDVIKDDLRDFQTTTDSAQLRDMEKLLIENLTAKIDQKDKSWVSLSSKISTQSKEKLEELDIFGLGFDPYQVRFYPEASMAAHVTGFVGKNEEGLDLGYFGIEGALNKELTPTPKSIIKSFFSNQEDESKTNGRDVITTVRRDVQFLIEEELKEAMERYQAKSGEVIVMDVETGQILGMAAFPQYEPQFFFEYPPELYRNPSVSSVYEPGSTLKVLTVAAGIESGAITPDTKCTRCDGPRKIDKYTIRTWNDEYQPDITITEALAKSDNTAMIFAEEEMSGDTFKEFMKKFGLGQKVTQDLQEDFSPSFPTKWGPVELATRSFGQGISLTSLQLVRAINSIANQGVMVQPQIIKQVIDHQTGETITTQPLILNRVVSAETATQVTQMMIESAQHGEAQWTATDQYPVAAKTGTSQIPNEDGGYDEDKTIASFVGFAPADHPKFIMLTKLTEPQSSPWAAETAAPLWYKIADKLILLL